MTTSPTVQRPITRASDDVISPHRLSELGGQLGVPVELDDTGWLRADIEIRIARNKVDHTLAVRSVRVSNESPVDLLVSQGGVTLRIGFYNQALRDLHQLRTDYDAFLAELEPRAEAYALASAERDNLAGLDYVVHGRQEQRMGSGVVTLRGLDDEIEFLRGWHSRAARARQRLRRSQMSP